MRYLQFVLFVVVILCALTGCQQKEYFMPPPATVSPDSKFVKEMRTKTGGDINKLSTEEKAKMDRITRGFTKEALTAPEIKPDN